MTSIAAQQSLVLPINSRAKNKKEKKTKNANAARGPAANPTTFGPSSTVNRTGPQQPRQKSELTLSQAMLLLLLNPPLPPIEWVSRNGNSCKIMLEALKL